MMKFNKNPVTYFLFFIPWYALARVCIRAYEMLVFRKTLRMDEIDDPFLKMLCDAVQLSE